MTGAGNPASRDSVIQSGGDFRLLPFRGASRGWVMIIRREVACHVRSKPRPASIESQAEDSSQASPYGDECLDRSEELVVRKALRGGFDGSVVRDVVANTA